MKKLLHFGLAISLIGCGKQYLITQNNYRVPRKDKFRLNNNFIQPDSSVLSPNVLYKSSDGYNFWFKFFPDGKVFYGHLSKVPKSINEQQKGFVGYYELKDTKLKVELYYVQQWKWDYLVLEGVVRNDTIQFYSDHYRKTRRNIGHFTNGFSFIKSSEPFVLRKPDW